MAALESKIEVTAGLVPRHYLLNLVAVLTPPAMIELCAILEALDVDDEAADGFVGKLREAVSEAYTGDLPQPIEPPDHPPEDDKPDKGEGTGGVATKTKPKPKRT